MDSEFNLEDDDLNLQKLIHSSSDESTTHLLDSLGLLGLPTKDKIHTKLQEEFLTPSDRVPAHWLGTYQIQWENKLFVPSLLPLAPAPSPTKLELVRTGLDGKVTGYVEVINPAPTSSITSTSLDRPSGSARTFVRGKTGNSPFLPGGLGDVVKVGDAIERDRTQPDAQLLSVPPGFSRGLNLPGEESEPVAPDGGLGPLVFKVDVDTKVSDSFHAFPSAAYKSHGIPQTSNEIDDLLPLDRSYLLPESSQTSQTKIQPQVPKRDWAHVESITKPNPEYEFLKRSGGLAKEYPFELDVFQKAAVVHLERNESVFVAAHTSAGKTVVAEYAIALAMRHVTRTIYTSPIKALSNQKFRDFKITFGSNNVGILTGDVQINPEAPCLIMTTEILRSMLYKGADLIRDVEWVVFDEVHYVSDAERGVVWEEVIIMLPEHVNIILLSATIPNAKEFADWVGRTKQKDIYVISTPKRPVPLEHYLYAGRDIFKIVDSKREFLNSGYKDASEALRRKQDKQREADGLPPAVRVGPRGARGAIAQRGQRGRGGPLSRGGGGGGGTTRTTHYQLDKSLFVHLVGFLRKKDLLPTVVFTFSKKRCEEQAATLNNVDLCSMVEKSEIHVALERALLRLSPSDKKLPQISRMKELLSRGIGVHHGGLLPIIKEVVEILFSRGLVRILFATETFAMGVNMPARCVVFSGIRKHDGKSYREILPGEYTQMSGRAGRRGLDTIGVVILLAGDELPDVATLHKMMLGTPARLQSQFRLTYNMILNLLRVEALRVEEMIKRSFSENASQRLLPDQQKKVTESEKILGSLPKLTCTICHPSIEEYYDKCAETVQLNRRIMELASKHPQGARLLEAGRVVVLKDGHFPSNIGVLLKVAPFQTTATGVVDHTKVYFVLALVSPETKARQKEKDLNVVPPRWPPTPASLLVDNGVYEVLKVSFASIAMITDRSIKVDVNSILERHKISSMIDVIARLNEIVHEWVAEESNCVPEVDWNRIRQLDFQDTIRKRDALASGLPTMACLTCPNFDEDYQILHGEKVLRANIAVLRLAISDQNLELLPDYEQRVQVLKELKFIDDNSTVLLKGRVACEINSAHELVLTELILENTLAAYEPEEAVALLSCFVFQEKTDVEPVIPPKIQAGQEVIMKIVQRIDTVQLRNNVGEDLNARIKFGLVEVVYEWAKGMPFQQITALTDVAEGTIVRVITRLDETCREIRDAARVIGDTDLFKKMEEAQIKIKRDIVFAASLYF